MHQSNHRNLRGEMGWNMWYLAGRYNPDSPIKFKTSMLKSSLCDYSNVYILVKGNIAVPGDKGLPAERNNAQLIAARQTFKVAFKNCCPFINCISEVNNTQINNAKDVDVVMLMYNSIDYADNYSKTSGGLWQYYKDIPIEENETAISDTESFKSVVELSWKAPAGGNRKNIKWQYH